MLGLNSPKNSQSATLQISGKPIGSRRPSHNPPKSLSQSEIQCLYDLLGSDCVTLATAVVQIFHAVDTSWTKQACGVLCFLKDYSQQSYCFRLYDLRLKQPIEEEIVPSSLYLEKKQDLFYVFDGINSKVGISFADNVEAEIFVYHFQTKQESRRKKKEPVDTSAQMKPEDQALSNNAMPKSSKNMKKLKLKSRDAKHKKDSRPAISSPVTGSFSVIMHVADEGSYVVGDAEKQLFEAVLSNMKLSSKQKELVRETVQNRENGLQKLFAETYRDYNNPRQTRASCFSENIPPDDLLIEGTRRYRSLHQDIAVPLSVYQPMYRNSAPIRRMPNTPTSPKHSKAPLLPPKLFHRSAPSPTIPDKSQSTAQVQSPLPFTSTTVNPEESNPHTNIRSSFVFPVIEEEQPMIGHITTPFIPANVEVVITSSQIPQAPPLPTSVESPMSSNNIPTPPPLPCTSPNRKSNEPPVKATPNFLNGLSEAVDKFKQRAANPDANRTQVSKPSQTQQSATQVTNVLARKIWEMVMERRPLIMGQSNDEQSDEDNDSDDDEWSV